MARFLAGLLLFSTLTFADQKEPITSYEILFSPRDHVGDELIRFINKEKKSIRAAVYCLMHRGIADALVQAKKRGVDVELIVDPFSVKTRSPLKKLALADIPIYVWNPDVGSKELKPLMHEKFCVLGDDRVWTGSFNFTFRASTSNCENVVVMDSAQVAGIYLDEFERIKSEGCTSYKKFLLTKKR